MSLPKFYVGQKVVAIANHVDGVFKKGDAFFITSVKKGCCQFDVTIGISPTKKTWVCPCCNARGRQGKEWLFNESNFAPIIEKFESISFTKVLEEELTSVN